MKVEVRYMGTRAVYEGGFEFDGPRMVINNTDVPFKITVELDPEEYIRVKENRYVNQ